MTKGQYRGGGPKESEDLKFKVEAFKGGQLSELVGEPTCLRGENSECVVESSLFFSGLLVINDPVSLTTVGLLCQFTRSGTVHNG